MSNLPSREVVPRGEMAPATASVPFAAEPVQPGVPQQSLLQVLWRRRWNVALAMAAALAVAVVYLHRAVPLYSTSSRFYVERSGPKIISDVEGVMTESFNYVYTQAELVKSGPILAMALEGPDLDVKSMKTFAGTSNPVGYMKSALTVSVGKKDDIISVSLLSPYPKEAAVIVNAVVNAYVSYHSKSRRNTAAEVVRILKKEKTKLDAELARTMGRMLEFKRSNVDLGFESSKGNVTIERLARLSDALTTAQLDVIDARTALASKAAELADPARLEELVEAKCAAGNYGSVGAELRRLRLESAALKREFSDSAPAVRVVDDRMAELKRQLIQAEKGELDALSQRVTAGKQKETTIRGFLDEQRGEALELRKRTAEYAVLETEWEQTKKLCNILNDRIREINVAEDAGAMNITILEAARPGIAPVSPPKRRTLAMALVLGAMLGVGLALARDYLDHRIRSAEEVSATLGMAILGVVPELKDTNVEVAGKEVELHPSSRVAEAYRTIRTAVYFGVPKGEANTIVITSPAPSDGKSTLTSNLGIAMALAGQRTLILDADFRKPVQHKIFAIETEHGLSSALAGRAALDDVIQKTHISNLDVLPCGPVPPNPSEMLGSGAFVDTLEELCERYEHILLDTPPVMAVTDARILAATCAATIIVLRAERSHRKAAERARDGLLSIGARTLGAVVNAVPPRQERYYYYAGYHHSRYGYRYARGDDGHDRRLRRRRGALARQGSQLLVAPESNEGAQ